MTKTPPKVQNKLDDDIFSVLQGNIPSEPKTEVKTQINPPKQAQEPVEINASVDFTNDFAAPVTPNQVVEPTVKAADDTESLTSSKKAIKDTQLVVRVTETEKAQIQTYFMKHGISISKGIKLAIKYLEMQEEKGQVRFTDFGLF